MLFRSCFQHLKDIERKRIVTPPQVTMRLNRGERPEPLPEELRRAIRARLRLNELQQYPSYQPFYKLLSEWVGFPTNYICVGAGIEEFIRTLIYLSCDPGEAFALYPWPSCAMYDIYARAFDVELWGAAPPPGTQEPVERVYGFPAAKVPRILFLVNPGQPVETHYSLVEMRQIAKACSDQDIVLAIDEAHFGFGAETALPLVNEFDNVVVLRTFSKYYSAASIRVGFAVGQPRVIAPLHAVRPSGEVTGQAITIASELLGAQAQVALFDSAKDTVGAREWLRDMINSSILGLHAYGRYGFSVLIQFPNKEEAEWVAAWLAKQGVYVKVGFPEPVEKCIMVSCGGKVLMERFYDYLRDACMKYRVEFYE